VTLDKKVGIIFGVFDLMHVGHVQLFEWAKQQVDYLVVGVNSGDHLEAHKNKPLLTANERLYLVNSCKFVDEAFVYKDEAELHQYQAAHLDYVRIMGDDHTDRFNGSDLPIQTLFHPRLQHNYSSTEMRRRIVGWDQYLE